MVTRTISMPYLNGSYATTGNQHGVVRLTSSRMIWVYGQTNPNWLVANIIDVPGGIASSGTPAVTTTQLFAQGNLNQSGYNTAVHRLNDNAFAVFSFNSSTGYSYWIGEIDSSNNITLTDSGTYSGGANFSGAGMGAGYNSNFIAEVADNVLLANAQPTTTSAPFWVQMLLTYDTTAKKLSMGGNGYVNSASQFSNTTWTVFSGYTNFQYNDWRAMKIPNQPYTLITHKVGISSYNNSGSYSMLVDQTGAMYMNVTQLPNYQAAYLSAYCDMVPLPGDRMLITSNNQATVFSMNYAAKTYSVLSQSQFANVTTTDTYGRLAIPLSTDYWMNMSKSQLVTPNAANTRIKIVRRVDTQFIEQSAASANNGGNGFALTAAPTTYINNYNPYPEFLNGKLFWWGFDVNQANNVTKLSWTVMSLPAS